MDLFAPLKRSLAEQNYITATPIQSQAIPHAVEGRDILGCAQTGTGKTAAFALPILDYLGQEQPRPGARNTTVLILAPTRELAIQIGESFQVYGKHMSFRMALVYGGVKQYRQVNALKRGVDVLVATPGRLLDLMDQKHIHLGNVQMLVLDEADRMLDMGFLPALKKIVLKLPKDRQSLFFSATLPKKTVELSNRLLFNPVHVSVAGDSPTVDRIDQRICRVQRKGKFSALRGLLASHSVKRAIVFTRTKRGANQVARRLETAGIGSSAIHGNKSQGARQRALDSFRNQQISVLVATDVASRGIDIDGVSHVINYDMPVDPESYVHRIGRTARAGSDGVAISFCTPEECSELHAIERFIGKQITVEEIGTGWDGPIDHVGRSKHSTTKAVQSGRRKRHSKTKASSKQKRRSYAK